MFFNHSKFEEKFSETIKVVFPILAIVLVLCFIITPIPPSILVTFLIGAVLLILGMLLFNVGVESSMTPIGERVGSIMTRSRNIVIMVLISFIMGMVITISEPDLQVLAQQVPSIPNMTLILAVAVGAGAFLVLAVLRMLLSVPLSYILLVFYGIIFILTMFVSADFLGIAFDSGDIANKFMGVTIADEKEIVYIVSKTKEKNAIMKAIMEKAGLNSKAKSICFSLPVSDTAGLRLLED